jgi:GT2 family glycosyltransferase
MSTTAATLSQQSGSFSVIIPTYARPCQLASCLESLTRLQPPTAGFEVIVVDDGSPRRLDHVVKPYCDRLNLTLLRKHNEGPGAARNTGARAARGRFLAFTDDDCCPAPDWLTALARRFEQTPRNLLGGRTVNRLTRNPYAVSSQMIVDMVYAFYNRDPEASRFFASNNFAVPADLFRQIGGFDSQRFPFSAEDRELCDRWLLRGHRMTYASEAVVLHAHDLSLRSYCKQHFAYGRGALRYHRLRGERGSGRMRDDMGFHTHLPRLLRERLAQLPFEQVWKVLALTLVWQIANAAGFFYEGYWPRGRTVRSRNEDELLAKENRGGSPSTRNGDRSRRGAEALLTAAQRPGEPAGR